MKIKAAVLGQMGAAAPYAISRPLTIKEVELAPPGPGEVLIRIVAAGLCHSDLSVINGNRPRPMPMVLGHEAAGIVVETGPDVTGLRPGDHAVMVFMPNCGQCLSCAEGRPALCAPGAAANGAGTLLAGTRRLSCDDASLNHHLGCSAFAEYAVVSQASLIKIDADLPLEIAALFGCAVLTGVGAVVNTAQLRPGQSAAIVGLGGVGLAAVLGAAAAGASRIVAVDLNDEKLALARSLGATDTVNAAAPDALQMIRDLTGGGVDVGFEMAGAARAAALAYQAVRRGGTTVVAGLAPPDATLSVPLVGLVADERTLKGSYIGTCVPRRDVPRYIAMYRRGILPVDRLISGVLSLPEINEGFDRLDDGQAVRQIIMMERPLS
jgi:alcohol dehydrogenase